jgi:hypothetical protein
MGLDKSMVIDKREHSAVVESGYPKDKLRLLRGVPAGNGMSALPWTPERTYFLIETEVWRKYFWRAVEEFEEVFQSIVFLFNELLSLRASLDDWAIE